MRNLRILLAALAASAVFGQSVPKRVFVDPVSRWESLHDTNGSGARDEFSIAITKSCPEVISVTDSRDSANYTVSVFRTTGSGSVLIYAGGVVVHSFKPGFTAKLQKVAEKVCEFVGSQK